MSTSLVKAISLRATYTSDLTGLQKDIATLKSVRRQLEKDGIRVPIRLDTSSLRSEATRAAEEYRKAFTSSLGSVRIPGFGSTSAGGIAVPTGSSMAAMRDFRVTQGQEIKRIVAEANDGRTRVVTSYKQLADGVVEVQKDMQRRLQDGSTKTTGTTTTVDTRPVQQLRKALDDLQAGFATKLGAAKGSKGDVAGVLSEQRQRLARELEAFGSLQGTSEFRRATTMMARLDRQIAEAAPRQARAAAQAQARESAAADRAARKAEAEANKPGTVSLRDAIDRIQADFAPQIGAARGSRGDVASVLSAQRDRLAREITNFAALDGTPEYRRATRLLTGLDRQIAQAVPQQQRATSAAYAKSFRDRIDRIIVRRDRDTQAALKENKTQEASARGLVDRIDREREVNRVLQERDAILGRQQRNYERLSAFAGRQGQTDSAARLENAGFRLRNERNQIPVDRMRERARAAYAEEHRGLERAIQLASNRYRIARETLNTEEKQAMKIRNDGDRGRALQEVAVRRAALIGDTAATYADLRSRANRTGNQTAAGRLDTAETNLSLQGQRDLRRIGDAARAAGGGIGAYTEELLKNAATFVKWYIPAQVAMKTFAAMGQGVTSAIAAQRAFKALENIFQGSSEEAGKLSQGVLELAIANGRSADEAISSATQWARLGFTRLQILTATETSLRAANVAEISAADATRELTATYKGFGLAVSDLPPLLDHLNSLSNKYNVTVNDLFQGMGRSAKVARDAGVSYQELSAIIATVADQTGRPGGEIGNSIKSIVNRVRRPKIAASLKEEFGIDTQTASGDAKSFTAVLSELAAVYPNLNRLERARLADLVAGSQQSNRFSVIVSSYTDALIAQAKASFDVNSAQRENLNILSSVDASVQRLKDSWTSLFHSFGQSGGFDWASQRLKAFSRLINSVNSDGSPRLSREEQEMQEFDEMSMRLGKGPHPWGYYRRGKSIRVLDDQTADMMMDAHAPWPGYLSQAWFGDRSKVSRDDIQNAIDRIRAGKVTSHGNDTDEGRLANISILQSLLDNPDAAKPMDALQRVKAGQSRLSGFTSAQSAFQAIARDLTAKNADPAKLLKQFDDAMVLIENLPNGFQREAAARIQIRPLLEGHRNREAATAVSTLADDFAAGRRTETATVEQERLKVLEDLQHRMEETRTTSQALTQAMAAATEPWRQQKLAQKIEATTTKLKEQEEAYRGVAKATAQIESDPLAGERGERLDAYSRELAMAAKAFGNGFDSGLPSLDSKLRIGAGLFQIRSLQQSLDDTRSENAGYIPPLERQIALYSSPDLRSSLNQNQIQQADAHLEKLRDQVNLHQQLEEHFESELTKMRQANAEDLVSLDLQRQVASLRESFDTGAASAGSFATRFESGRSEGEKLANRARGLLGSIRGSMDDPFFGYGGPQASARDAGELASNLAATKTTLANLEDRMNRAIADRAQLEVTITEESRKQREEATKRLALASREDQLRTAAAAAVLRNSGRNSFSMRDFQYFSEASRNAISNYLPGGVKGLDDRERENNRSRADLDREINLIAVSLKTLREQFNAVRGPGEDRAAGLADPTRLLPRGAEAHRIINSQDPVRFDVRLGAVTVNVSLAEELNSIRNELINTVRTEVQSNISRLNPAGSNTAPNTTPAAGTF